MCSAEQLHGKDLRNIVTAMEDKVFLDRKDWERQRDTQK